MTTNQITLNVPQGLGDIFWIYQKISPLFDKININICYINELNDVQKRSVDWMKIFPKIGDTNLIHIKEEDYIFLFSTFFDLKNLILSKDVLKSHFYSCNAALEKGIRIEKIDSKFPIELNVNLKTQNINLSNKDYCVFYVSGTARQDWLVNAWVQLFNLIYKKYKLDLPVYLLGSHFDEHILKEISSKIKMKNEFFIGKRPEEVVFLIKNAQFFIGHQSGLNIIADNYNVKQLMIYYNTLANLTESWPKLQNIQNKIYNYNYFKSSINDIIEKLPINLF